MNSEKPRKNPYLQIKKGVAVYTATSVEELDSTVEDEREQRLNDLEKPVKNYL